MASKDGGIASISVLGLIAGAFAFVAALAWNSAMQRAMTELLGEQGASVWAGFLYALVVTLIVVVAVWLLKRGHRAAKSLWQQLIDDEDDDEIKVELQSLQRKEERRKQKLS